MMRPGAPLRRSLCSERTRQAQPGAGGRGRRSSWDGVRWRRTALERLERLERWIIAQARTESQRAAPICSRTRQHAFRMRLSDQNEGDGHSLFGRAPAFMHLNKRVKREKESRNLPSNPNEAERREGATWWAVRRAAGSRGSALACSSFRLRGFTKDWKVRSAADPATGACGHQRHGRLEAQAADWKQQAAAVAAAQRTKHGIPFATDASFPELVP